MTRPHDFSLSRPAVLAPHPIYQKDFSMDQHKGPGTPVLSGLFFTPSKALVAATPRPPSDRIQLNPLAPLLDPHPSVLAHAPEDGFGTQIEKPPSKDSAGEFRNLTPFQQG